MCPVLLPPGDNPIAVNKYIVSYHILIQIFSLFLSVEITSEFFPYILDKPYGLKNPLSLLNRSTSKPNPNTTKTSTPIRDQSLTLFILLLRLLKLKMSGIQLLQAQTKETQLWKFQPKQTQKLKKKCQSKFSALPYGTEVPEKKEKTKLWTLRIVKKFLIRVQNDGGRSYKESNGFWKSGRDVCKCCS